MSMSRPSSVFSQFRRTSKLVVLAGVCGLALAGCAGKPKRPEIATQQRPIEQIYAAGAGKLDDRQWSDAIQYFHEVERQYPYSEWARRAILMTAYAHYQSNAYDDARDDADRFISLYPGNPSTVYAYYIKATCYFEQIIDVGRDQAATEQALAALREVVRRYPTTEYATDAKLKIDMVNDQLAGKEMAIGRYYLHEGQPLAAIGRFRTVVDKYQTTSDAPEALYRLVESYLTLGLDEEAKRNAAVLGYNYPGDRWYQDAYNLMQGKGLRPQIVPVKKNRPGGIRFPSLPFTHGKALKPPASA
jgi:outer membrane protein assembly factor BamD